MDRATHIDKSSADNSHGDLPIKQPKVLAILYHRLNYLTLGSIIVAARNYADRTYVLMDGDDPRILPLARSLGAEVIEKADTPYVELFRQLMSENSSDVLVALYGDGTHDPDNIPELLESINQGFDAAIGPGSCEHRHGVNEAILYLNNKRPRPEHAGIIACSALCFRHIRINFVMDIRSDIPGQFIARMESAGLRIKHLKSSGHDDRFVLFNLYRIAVVVPTYNEELLIAETLKGIPDYVHRIYAIDDGSSDRTWEIINSVNDVRVVPIRHEANRGVGAAIVTGYKRALADHMDIVAIMAGDNQMDPEQLPRLIMPIIEGKADYTKGNRLISKEFRKGMSKWRSFGNFLLTMLTKIASGYWSIADPQNGYTAISRRALEALDLDSVYTYYGYCNDLLVKMNAYGLRTMDIIMPSRYGRERSKIRYSKYILKVSPMLFKQFLWRLKTKYILLDFNPLVLFYAASMVMVPAGIFFGILVMAEKVTGQPISQNFPMFTVFFTLIGIQFLIFAMLFDMQADKGRSEISY